MMKLQKIYRRLCLAAWSAGLLATLQGCVFGETVDAPQAMSGDTYTMSITVVTNSSAASRANHDDDEQQTGTDAENYIDFGNYDFSLVLFDENGNFIQKIDCDKSWKILPSTSGTSNVPTTYLLETEIFPETIDDATLETIKKDGFQVMALANWKANGAGSYDRLGSSTTLDAIWKDDANYNFSYTPTSTGGINQTWLPSVAPAAQQLIPMFGLAQASAFKPRSSTSLYSSAMIPMQRAMAKIEVIDNLKDDDPSVTGVTMTAFNTSGRFIPDVEANPDWNQVGSQVSSSSLPKEVAPLTDLKFFQQGANSKTWVAYVPEMALTKNVIDDSRTHLNVELGGSNTASDGTYPVHFAKYDQTFKPTIPDDSWNHILRNHIYRYQISGVNKPTFELELHLHVIPWVADAEEIWDFTDHITLSQSLQWSEGGVLVDGSEDSGNSMKEVTANADGELNLSLESGKWLEGRFTIQTPVNGKWYARLTPLEDAQPYAMSFVNDKGQVMEPKSGDPETCTELSGTIDGNQVTLRISPTNFGNDYGSKFRLEFFVENLGYWMEVPMTADGSNYKYYTIVRPRNIIE